MPDSPKTLCGKCGLPTDLCCCKEIKDEHESKTFSSNAGTMYDCPYAPGSACNQRKLMCDQQKYDIHCLLAIFRSITTGVHASHEYLRKDGMEHALLWLFDHDCIRPKFEKYSVMQIVEMIIKDEKYTKENIDR